MESSKLPPIWEQVISETETYKSHGESKELQLKKCPHKNLKMTNGSLRCLCGAGWSGSGLHELEKALLNR